MYATLVTIAQVPLSECCQCWGCNAAELGCGINCPVTWAIGSSWVPSHYNTWMDAKVDWLLSKRPSSGTFAFHHLKLTFSWTEKLALRPAATLPPGNERQVPLGCFAAKRTSMPKGITAHTRVSNRHQGWRTRSVIQDLMGHLVVLPLPVTIINRQLHDQDPIRAKQLKARTFPMSVLLSPTLFLRITFQK